MKGAPHGRAAYPEVFRQFRFDNSAARRESSVHDHVTNLPVRLPQVANTFRAPGPLIFLRLPVDGG
jgi:hypothetical protein